MLALAFAFTSAFRGWSIAFLLSLALCIGVAGFLSGVQGLPGLSDTEPYGELASNIRRGGVDH